MKFVMTIILTMMMVVPLTAKLLNMVLRAPPMKPDCHRVLPPVAMGKKRRMKFAMMAIAMMVTAVAHNAPLSLASNAPVIDISLRFHLRGWAFGSGRSLRCR